MTSGTIPPCKPQGFFFCIKRESHVGKTITMHVNPSFCAHAGHCTDNLSSVFRMNEAQWRNEVIAVVNRCPPGALSYSVDGI
jgi:uncharacterized Fe-S cluster protein YjdI